MELPLPKPENPKHYELVPKRELSYEIQVKVGQYNFEIKKLSSEQLQGVMKLAQEMTRFVLDSNSILIKVTYTKFIDPKRKVKNEI